MDLSETNSTVETRLPAQTGIQNGVELSPEVLATLVEIGDEINASLDLDHVLERSAALVKRLVDYEIFALMLIDERTQELYFRFAIGHRQEVVETWRWPVGQGITGTAAATGQPVLVPDVSQDPRYLNALDSVRSEIAVPLIWNGRTVGVLDIQSRELNSFTREQQQILALLAGRIAGAIENARLFESTRRQADTLLVLNEVAREASSILDVEELLRRAADLIKRVIDYQMLSIMVYDADAQRFTHAVDVRYGRSEQSKLAVGPTGGIVGAAVASGRPIRVPDVSQDPRYILCNPETRSELTVPMMYKGRVAGVIDLESPVKDFFTDQHVQTLSILAASLAVALENARLYEQLARDEARMDRELQAARRMQGALLPSVPTGDFGLDIAARYAPARQVGGDIYDFLRYGPQQLAVAMGDVSGKGAAAALYGATTVGMLRSLATQKLRPSEMLRQLNQHLTERRIEARFMTLCFATWQKGRQRLRIANAGHWQPLLWKDGRCEKVPITGLPLGIEDDAGYEERAYHLAAGEILVFYSDGITETANAAGEFFGAARLQDLVARHRLLDANGIAAQIFKEMEAFAPGDSPADDRTLVVLKVR
jgi:sigma-B regulation protein RsbU (phosphoserine phosphatase)